MLHNICISAVAMSLRGASRGPWASCSYFSIKPYIVGLHLNYPYSGSSNEYQEVCFIEGCILELRIHN